MAGINQFFPFATAPGANVLTPSTWSAAVGRQTGAVAGLAKSVEANTAWRQGTVIAAMIGDFIAQRGYDALDNADLTTLRANFESALGAQFSASLVHYVVDEGTTANTLVLADITPDVPLIANGMAFVIVPATTNTGAVNAVVTQQGGTVNVPVITRGGTALAAGDIAVGRPFIAIFYAGSLRIQGLVNSELVTGALFQSIYNQFFNTPAPYWRLDTASVSMPANTNVTMSNWGNKISTEGLIGVNQANGVVTIGTGGAGVYLIEASGAVDGLTTEETCYLWKSGSAIGSGRGPYPPPGADAMDKSAVALTRVTVGDTLYATYAQLNPSNSPLNMFNSTIVHFTGVRVAG